MDSNQAHSQGMAQRRRWRERQHLAGLCDLVADSLLPYLEPQLPATRRPELTREEERRVLLELSRVNRVIRGWDDDDDDSDEVDDGDASDQMLMIRLKPHMQQNCSHIIGLLKLLRDHFQNLLHEPMSQHITELENCLEGSPFLLSVVGLGELQDKSTRHLQRQAVYLFLSCCIFLACSGNGSRQQCSWKTDDFCHEVQGCTNHCNCFGLSEISDWFQRCWLDKILDSESSTNIVLFVLQLYMEEDDILFIILLQLLDAPLISLAIDNMETKWTSKLMGAKLFSIIFDPVHTFHLLLSLLHYDHLVLVDYLISKDVGVHCAQYLLRCLRLVSQSWNAFVDDSVYEAHIQNLTCKRQRTVKNINSFAGSSIQGTKLGSSREMESKSKKQLFLSAKVCLLSLKRTLEDLHQKDLFPYNPKPLLKSLARFVELCQQC